MGSVLTEKGTKAGMRVEVKRLSSTAKMPVRGSEQAAGYDLFADMEDPVQIKPQETLMIDTGLAFAIPQGYFGGIFARSGLSAKMGLRPANCTGVVDSDYRGPVKVALHNDSGFIRTVEPYERIAQLIVMPYLNVTFDAVEELDATARGEGGFGSTGKV